MQVTLSRKMLLKPLQLISGVVEKRHTLPILGNTLIKMKDNQLSFTATDLEIEMIGRVTLPHTVDSGATTVSARKLLDICRSLPEEAEIQLSLDESQGHLLVRSVGSRFSLVTLPPKTFPSIEEGSFAHEFTISQQKLRSLIGKIYFAMGQQDVRHYLNGALFDINQKVIKCVATDGHRLAFVSTEHLALGDAKIKIILPRKSVLELVRLLNIDDESDVTVCIGENHFRVTSTDFVFTSKLISAQYPDYDKLIPRQIENTAIASREALKQALTRASILSNEKFRGIRLQLGSDTLRIMANNTEQEEAEETITLQYQGNNIEIGFNVAYLLDVLSTMVSESIRWSFSDPNAGILIESFDRDDSLYVVMPMRL